MRLLQKYAVSYVEHNSDIRLPQLDFITSAFGNLFVSLLPLCWTLVAFQFLDLLHSR
jgi:hypothetical protein